MNAAAPRMYALRNMTDSRHAEQFDSAAGFLSLHGSTQWSPTCEIKQDMAAGPDGGVQVQIRRLNSIQSCRKARQLLQNNSVYNLHKVCCKNATKGFQNLSWPSYCMDIMRCIIFCNVDWCTVFLKFFFYLTTLVQ